MLLDLAISTAMVVWTVVFHALGLFALSRGLRIEVREERAERIHPASPRAIGFTVALVLGLFVIHGVEIWSYALLYFSYGAVGTLAEAVYFSTITYATIGYDADLLSTDWRIVAAIEGINGVILMGWSTAFFVTLVLRLGRR